MPVAGGAENVVVASAVGRNFAITRNGIYYMRRRRADETGPALDVYRFDTGKTKTIANFGFNVEAGLAISPDEKQGRYAPTKSRCPTHRSITRAVTSAWRKITAGTKTALAYCFRLLVSDGLHGN